MRIAICTDQYLPMVSGLVDSVHTLEIALRERGHEVRVYAPKLPGALPGGKPDQDVFRFPAWEVPGSNGGIILNFPFGAMRDMRQFKPDIVQTELFGMAGILAWYAARRLGVPLVGTDHTFPADYLHYLKLNFRPFPYLVRKYAAWYYGRCDFVTTPSQRMMDELTAYGMRRPGKIISNPIPALFRKLDNRQDLKTKLGIGSRAILVFGRIAREKNLDAALDVYADVAKRSNAELVFIGDGSHTPTLKKRIHQYGLERRVKFLGVLRGQTLVEALNAGDVLLITSTSENQPMTLLQAMACGLPTVAADAGGVPEYVQDGVTGYVVPPTNTRLFADRIVQLFEDNVLAASFAKTAQMNARRFSPEEIATQFETVYTQVTRI